MAYFDVRISVGLWSVCCRFVIGLSSRLSVCCRLRVQHCADDRFSIGVMSVIYRSQIGRFHTESYPTWTRLVLRCLQQHCRWPTAGRFSEKIVFFVGFVSVWPVWLGYEGHCSGLNHSTQCDFIVTRIICPVVNIFNTANKLWDIPEVAAPSIHVSLTGNILYLNF